MTLAQQSRSAPMLERVCELPVLPHVIFSILEPVGPSEPCGDQLERIIGVDPGLTAKALSLANSQPFGSPGSAASLSEAVQALGYRPLRTLAMTAATFEMFVGKNDLNSLRRRRWWRQSVDTAVTARWLAQHTGRSDSSKAYTAGLLHLLGKSLLDRYGGADYTMVTEMEAGGERDWQAEQVVYGCTHVELLQDLAHQWRLSTRLIEDLAYTSPPAGSDLPGRACVAIATRVAAASVRGKDFGFGELATCPEWALAVLGVSREELRVALEQGLGSLAKMPIM